MQVKSRNLVTVPIAVVIVPQHGYEAVVNHWWATDGKNVFFLHIKALMKSKIPLAYPIRQDVELVAGKFEIPSVIRLPVAYIKPIKQES